MPMPPELRGRPGPEDVPLRDLVAECDAQGHRAEADAYVQRILANHDAEVKKVLSPRPEFRNW